MAVLSQSSGEWVGEREAVLAAGNQARRYKAVILGGLEGGGFVQRERRLPPGGAGRPKHMVRWLGKAWSDEDSVIVEPLDDPSQKVEPRSRATAFDRAMARFVAVAERSSVWERESYVVKRAGSGAVRHKARIIRELVAAGRLERRLVPVGQGRPPAEIRWIHGEGEAPPPPMAIAFGFYDEDRPAPKVEDLDAVTAALPGLCHASVDGWCRLGHLLDHVPSRDALANVLAYLVREGMAEVDRHRVRWLLT